MAVSTVPAAKQALLDMLSARVGLTGVTVTRGGPSAMEDFAREHIFLGSVEGDVEPKLLGGRSRDEEYTIPVTCRVINEGDDEATTEERAYEIAEEVRSAIREAHPNLNGTLNQWALESRFTENTQPIEPSAWATTLTLYVVCKARI